MTGEPEATPTARVLMVQGTSSHAGKSTLVTALCRVFARAGYTVAPFKAQNMANNAAVLNDGSEIGRAQAIQALAAGVTPTPDMNPVLLKPRSDRTSQVIRLGRPWLTTDARGFYDRKSELWPTVTDALDRLRASHDIVIIEGAGSPAEINLAQYDIVNMRVARYANAPVLLVGDIDRGGVFASLYGTVMLLTPEERALVRGFIINKFRGDPSLLTPGFGMLEDRTNVPTLGVLPYMELGGLPAEDGLELDSDGRLATSNNTDAVLDVVVIRLPRITSLDEFQPLAREAGVQLRFVRDTRALGNPDLVIIPGTMATPADLAFLRERGLDDAIVSLHTSGTPVLGIAGGYQILGQSITDPAGAELRGLGLLPVATTLTDVSTNRRVRARMSMQSVIWPGYEHDEAASSDHEPFDAYEIRTGHTRPLPGAVTGDAPFAVTSTTGDDSADGSISPDGLVVGSYLHGLLEVPALRRGLLGALAERKGVVLPPANAEQDTVEVAFDRLADALADHLDMQAIFDMVGLPMERTDAR